MVIMDVKADNILCFNDFHINMSYPKKIVDSSINNEFLPSRPNFRYKKVNIIMGANASGKTSFGKLLRSFANYFSDGAFGRFVTMVDDPDKDASLQIEFVSDDYMFNRFYFIYSPEHAPISDIKSCKIGARDSYETCCRKIDKDKSVSLDYTDVDVRGWCFCFPEIYDGNNEYSVVNESDEYCKVLETVLKTLDISIEKVIKLNDAKNAYVIKLVNHEVIIQNGKINDPEKLSSGTKAGIEIAYVIASLIIDRHDFYYCDEMFSFVNSDVEKACISIIIDFLNDSKQLFFTTHNTDVLDMDLPKHSYTFFKKDKLDDNVHITAVYASDYLKKSSDSLKNAVDNDLFCTAPELDMLFSLTE